MPVESALKGSVASPQVHATSQAHQSLTCLVLYIHQHLAQCNRANVPVLLRSTVIPTAPKFVPKAPASCS